jgi:hypothetical protein
MMPRKNARAIEARIKAVLAFLLTSLFIYFTIGWVSNV